MHLENKKKKGAAMLVTVLLLGGVIVEIGIANLFLLFYSQNSVFGVKFSAEALSAAKAGLEDAVIKVVRNKDINYVSSGSPYQLTVGGRTATIIICKDSETVNSACDTPAVGKTEVTSTGAAFNRQRKLRKILNVDALTGEISSESVEELAI